jgi:hypothetical protein
LKNYRGTKSNYMKKIIICAALALSATCFKEAAAQIRFNVHVNIGSQPVWGPVGYDYAEYYYLPDIETYYYVPTHQFIYLNGGRWVFSRSLPYRYRNYNLYSGYKVVVNEPRAYMHFNDHRARYSSYRGNRSQQIIRNSDERRYWEIKGHPRYNRHDNGRGHGHGRYNH